MPIDSKAGNEQASVSKIQIKEVTMATFHGSPYPGTCHTEFSVENKYTYLDKGPTINQEASGRGQTDANGQSYPKQDHECKTTQE